MKRRETNISHRSKIYWKQNRRSVCAGVKVWGSGDQAPGSARCYITAAFTTFTQVSVFTRTRVGTPEHSDQLPRHLNIHSYESWVTVSVAWLSCDTGHQNTVPSTQPPHQPCLWYFHLAVSLPRLWSWCTITMHTVNWKCWTCLTCWTIIYCVL